MVGILTGAQPALSAPLTYQTFVARAQAMRAGATRDEIVSALGKPSQEAAAYLEYDLMGLKGMPPQPGSTVYYAAEFDLQNGRLVGAVKWAWMDTSGMAAPPPKKPPR